MKENEEEIKIKKVIDRVKNSRLGFWLQMTKY